MRRISGWVALVGVIALAVISGGPTAHGRGSQVWGSSPVAPCDTWGRVEEKCYDKNGDYCGVKWLKCREKGPGEQNQYLCVKEGEPAAACDNAKCNSPDNPAHSDKKNSPCTVN